MSGGEEPLLGGRVILITGAANGIGRAVAEACAREGGKLVLCDVGCDREGHGSDPELVARAAAALRATGTDVVLDASDITGDGVPARLCTIAREAFGRLDGVVSCAGVSIERTVGKSDDALVSRVLDVHVRASFSLVRAASAAMIEGKVGGSIVLASGTAAFFGARGQAALGGAQAAIVALARSAALELRRHDVRVNAVVPTAKTRATEDLPTFASIAEGSLSPEHVAALVVFLLSPLAAEVSGEVVGVAGARTYAFRTRESPGAFAEGGPASPRWLAAQWRDVVR